TDFQVCAPNRHSWLFAHTAIQQAESPLAHRQACLCSVRLGWERLLSSQRRSEGIRRNVVASITRSSRRRRRWAVTKETALLDDLHHFRRHHFLPTAVTGLQFGERVRRENLEVLRMIIGDFGDEIVIHDELEKRLQVGSDRDLTGRNDFAASFVDHWINVEFKRTLEHPP